MQVSGTRERGDSEPIHAFETPRWALTGDWLQRIKECDVAEVSGERGADLEARLRRLDQDADAAVRDVAMTSPF